MLRPRHINDDDEPLIREEDVKVTIVRALLVVPVTFGDDKTLPSDKFLCKKRENIIENQNQKTERLLLCLISRKSSSLPYPVSFSPYHTPCRIDLTIIVVLHSLDHSRRRPDLCALSSHHAAVISALDLAHTHRRLPKNTTARTTQASKKDLCPNNRTKDPHHYSLVVV